MSDSSPSTVVTTEPTPGVSPASPPATSPSVSTAQTPDVATLIATYEGRVRNLQSDLDKQRDAVSKLVAENSRLQQELAEYKSRADATVTASNEAARSSLERSAQLERDLSAATAARAKYAALLARPHLAAYSTLIPETSDEAQLTQVLDTLETIRNRDLEAARASSSPTLPSLPLANPATPPLPTVPTVGSLYGGRPNMAPAAFSVPASSPAAMHPSGGEDVNAKIASILARGRASGNMADFEAALEEAKGLVPSALGLAR